MPLLIRIFATALLAGPLWAFGQATRATTAPAVADPPSPKAALRELNVAMRDGDVATIQRMFLATTPAERKMVAADAQMAAALADLRRAAVAAYGDAPAKTVTGDTVAGAAESLVRIDTAEVTINGDTATINYRDERDGPFVLKKVDGEWKVPVSELGKPLDPVALKQRLADLAVQTSVVRDVTKLIRDNKLPTAEQAREAWQNRILQAATSQPANRAERPARE
ncbi:MAG TPA: hypothetical protein VGI81_28640 [Tepidisphaeraceae bacterium]|jgi:hypothetical protein